MGILDRLEQSFTQLEGTIFSLFRIQLQPVEISKRLERAMLADKRIGAGKTLVPNAYEVHLNPGDYKEFAGYKDSLCRDLAMALTEAARKHRVTPLTAIHIDLLQDKSVPARNPRVSAQMIDRPRQHTPVNEYSASAARGHTSVFIPAASAGGFR
ncbi:MAG TPA: DUF3662 domain-containing protein, partial [Thermomicrobiales bacterium]|nr:DUF3662 domain-containing protein [Thermomicrobiales bacterium]